jgi:hypothetical protein
MHIIFNVGIVNEELEAASVAVIHRELLEGLIWRRYRRYVVKAEK